MKMLKKQTILVTGGYGFIGSQLCNYLLQQGYHVNVLDNLNSQVHGSEPKKSFLYRSVDRRVNFICGSVNNERDWLDALQNVSVVFHMAAETGTGQSMYDINHHIKTNILGLSTLLNLISTKKISLDKIILPSSRSVYGEGKYVCDEHGVFFPEFRKDNDLKNNNFDFNCHICGKNLKPLATDEESRLKPKSIYAITKQTQEQILMQVCNAYNIKYTIFRYQNVYGPGQSLQNPYTGVLSIFSNLILLNKKITIFEDGLESRDFIYIDDVIKATVLGLKYQSNNKIYNVGSGNQTSINNLIEHIAYIFDKLVFYEIS